MYKFVCLSVLKIKGSFQNINFKHVIETKLNPFKNIYICTSENL